MKKDGNNHVPDWFDEDEAEEKAKEIHQVVELSDDGTTILYRVYEDIYVLYLYMPIRQIQIQ